ncbi:EVE domain-containing protein [Micromonospora sp. L31]|uniref:EVE domain-containing protein n=1 Tax=Micromonospora sp. L31 TaxID=3452213 RepID=UPI003F8BCC2D
MEQARVWFFQSNPKLYDIDAALAALDRIWWRVPQYTNEIRVGDVVVLWRSGKDAGIVGLGRVVADPRLRPMEPAEKSFVLAQEEAADNVTRALVRVQAVPFVSKERVRAVAELEQHQLLVAPMGTVFPVAKDQWAALSQLVPTPPGLVAAEKSALPPTFAWPQRAKGVMPMPGGYSGYLQPLKKVCSVVAEERPTPTELAGLLEAVLKVKPAAARLRESFLRKVGVVDVQGGVCRLGPWTEKWLASDDDRLLIALLHGRCQFIGELLAAAGEPVTNEQLLAVANDRYGMGWDTQTQVGNRRGWLQSARMLADTGDGKVQVTAAGRALLAELTLHDPTAGPPVETIIEPPRAEPPIELSPAVANAVDGIADAIKSFSTDSPHPDRFERAVRDAFAFLGFQAEWLGGSGKTDVLLDATLGTAESYRVVVDCKTSGSGAVGDQQVDWVTLTEHKAKHDADHIALVAPNPSGKRLLERARQHKVAIISADQLAGLCRQHAKTPLGLDDYRSLFARGGSLDTEAVDERAEEVRRLITLAAAMCEAIRDRSTVFGRLSARDLLLILAGQPVAEGTTEDELQALLDTLASPLLGVLHGSRSEGYRVTTSPEVAQRRIEAVAQQLAI